MERSWTLKPKTYFYGLCESCYQWKYNQKRHERLRIKKQEAK